MRVTPFVILFHPRAGSSWLISVLKTAPGIHADYEILARVEDAVEQRKVADRFWAKADTLGVRAGGFKCAPYQLRDRFDFLQQLRERGVRLIALLRRDLLRAAISQVRASALSVQRGRQNLRRGDQPLGPVPIPPQALKQSYRALRNDRDFVRLMACCHGNALVLTYEDLVAKPHRQIRRIARHLRTEIAPTDFAPTQKVTSDEWRRDVSNADELETTVKTLVANYANDL